MRDFVLFMKQEVQMLAVADQNIGATFYKGFLIYLHDHEMAVTVPANIFVFQLQKPEGVTPVSEKQRLFQKFPSDFWVGRIDLVPPSCKGVFSFPASKIKEDEKRGLQ